jgi:hypothetical protein
MFDGLERVGLLALYQTTVLIGILLMPLALLARKAGLQLPLERVLATLGEAYDERVESR